MVNCFWELVNMNKFFNFLKYGRGIGITLLAVIALIVTLQAVGVGKNVVSMMIPNVQTLLDEVLPIKIENGEVVVPEHTYKEVDLTAPFDANTSLLKVVIDTTRESVENPTAKGAIGGIYMTKKFLYYKNKTKTEIVSLENTNLNLEKKDYREEMKKQIDYYANYVGLFIFVLLILYYLVVVLVCSFVSLLFTIKWQEKLRFTARMRTASLAYLLLIKLNFGMSDAVMYVSTLALIFVIMLPMKNISNAEN